MARYVVTVKLDRAKMYYDCLPFEHWIRNQRTHMHDGTMDLVTCNGIYKTLLLGKTWTFTSDVEPTSPPNGLVVTTVTAADYQLDDPKRREYFYCILARGASGNFEDAVEACQCLLANPSLANFS